MKLILLLLLCAGRIFAGDGTLYTRYLQAQVIDQVKDQRASLLQDVDAEKATQVDQAFAAWRKQQLGQLKQDLESEWGENAKEEFSRFSRTLAQATQSGEVGLIQNIAEDLNLRPVPENFSELQSVVLNQRSDSLVPVAAKFLGEVETWLDLPEGSPSLSAWLNREVAPEPTPKPAQNPLRAAEAGGAEWVPPQSGTENPMDAFSRRREEKREQALEEAHAGMRQVANEREGYEREKASIELARAREDAEAMRAQAQRLAATEEEALQQRENSWGNRLKRIVGGTVSAATGAFTGGIGAEAGQRAADAVFN